MILCETHGQTFVQVTVAVEHLNFPSLLTPPDGNFMFQSFGRLNQYRIQQFLIPMKVNENRTESDLDAFKKNLSTVLDHPVVSGLLVMQY